MAENTETFLPGWVSPPGETIEDLLGERGWKQGELADRLGYTDKHLSLLINGKASLTEDAAMKLERVLGASASFWLAREAKYREHLARLGEKQLYESWVGWLDQLPITQLMNLDVIPKLRNAGANKLKIVQSCLKFFGVASPNEWEKHYGGMQVSYRRTKEEQSDIGAISSWLRMGELEAEKFPGPPYNKAKFEQALTVIKGLTTEPPEVFAPKMYQALEASGVVFVLVPSIPRAHVSGVARWLRNNKPLIQLSLYGKNNDKFWFTFFHEAAHILLHADNRQAKKAVFLDDLNNHQSDDPKEHEANQWAADFLIPQSYIHELSSIRSKESVERFSAVLGIHPGIVVGRLQHEGFIKQSWMNGLKESFHIVQ